MPARAASWVIDTGLLSAGALLWATLQINPLVQTWLGAKLVLLLVYIGLGTMALRRAHTPAARLVWTMAALGCFGWMVATAIAHDTRAAALAGRALRPHSISPGAACAGAVQRARPLR